MGSAEQWLRSTKPCAYVTDASDDAYSLLVGALDNFGEWSLHRAEKRGFLTDVWSEAIEAAEALKL